MKKTIKKQLILFAVVTVMMICALVMTASAEDYVCPAAADPTQPHDSYFIKDVTYAPTCTQRGYTVKYCDYCKRNITSPENYVDMTGHSYTVSYEENGDSYNRILTCQNDLCYRAEKDGEKDLVGTSAKDVATYYTVKYVNNYESPDSTQADHANYFESDYYVASSQVTWLAKDYISEYYLSGTAETVDGSVYSPAYEYAIKDGEVKLFVKSGETAPEYKGETPYRFKDKTVARYYFSSWSANGKTPAELAIEENTVFEAQFTAQDVKPTYTFYDGDGTALTSGVTVDYGAEISYGLLKTPTKANDQRYSYTFDGWTLGKNGTYFKDSIKIYYDVSIFAHFDERLNEYDITFVDFYNNELGVSENVVYGGLAPTINSISDKALEVPRDKAYIYTYANAWTLKTYNGLKVVGNFDVNPRGFDVPAKLTVVGEDGVYREEALKDGDAVTIAPKYTKRLVQYYIPIDIKTVYFEDEDLFEDNSMVRSDILDDFVIQVTDVNGQYVAGGMTDENGRFMLVTTYSDVLYITAKTTSSSKYYGEHTLNLAHCTLEDLANYEFSGIGIAPRVTQEWLDGNTHSCQCICHSIFSTIVVRVYNLLYRLFNVKYVCCDDLFVTHGKILAYTK